MLTTHYVATVQVLVEAEDEAKACDFLNRLLSGVRDWGYLKVGAQPLSPSSTMIEVDGYQEGTFLDGDEFRNAGLVMTGGAQRRMPNVVSVNNGDERFAMNEDEDDKLCEECNERPADQGFVADPFQSEVNDDHTKKWQCSKCYQQSLEEV